MNKKGIALIMAVGILAILATIATSFALNMRLEYRAATNYCNGVKARYFAESALARAMAELRTHVRTSAFDDLVSLTETWGTSGYTNTNICGNIDGAGTSQTISIVDEQRKININTISSALMLGNLITILQNKVNMTTYGPLSSSDANSIFNKGPHATPVYPDYSRLDEIIYRSGNTTTKTKLDLIRNFLTTDSYRDANSSDRAPININTADRAVIAAVIRGVLNTSTTNGLPMVLTGITTDEAWIVAGTIVTRRAITPITSWKSFDDAIDAVRVAGYISANQAAVIEANCNPNRTKPSTNTTEFCFNSGGYYTITATGTVTDLLSANLASRTLTAVVKLYDIYCETTKDQFELGTPVRVTWLDSCPVDSDDLFGSYGIPSDAVTVPGSLKIGFWDDFDEDSTYSTNEWIATSGTRVFNDADADGDIEMTDQGLWTWGKYELQNASKWTWSNFNLRVFCYDMQTGTQMKEVGQILFRGGAPAALHAKQGTLEWSLLYAYENPLGSGTGNVDFWTDTQAAAYGYNPSTDKYVYPGQVTIWKGFYNDPCDDQSICRTLFGYNTKKVHNLLANGSNATDSVYTSSSSASFGTSGVSTAIGITSLYGQRIKVAWDDIRIISPDGNFTSQAINSSVSPGLASIVEWGTITGTLTIPSTASASETVSFQTRLTGGTVWNALSAGNHIASANGNSIQYQALLATSDAQINETPVLEDITITYLPKVEIRSYALTQ